MRPFLSFLFCVCQRCIVVLHFPFPPWRGCLFPLGSDLCYNHCGLPRCASQASDCAAAARRARPRCCAPFDAARSTPCGGSCGLRVCGTAARCPQPSVLRTLDAACPAAHGGQALRYACAWLRASWLSAISGASRPSASLGRRLRVCGTAARCPQPSVLRTLDTVCPAWRYAVPFIE